MKNNPPFNKKTNQSEPKERKSLPIFVTKVDEEQGIVEAIASVMGVIDYGNDIIHNGAYLKTIVERKGSIRILDQHRTESIQRVLGKPLEIREIGRNELPQEILTKFPMASGGLSVIIQFNMKVEDCRDAFYKIASGDINEYSIGYDAMDFDYSEITDSTGKKFRVRNLRAIRLWEISPVIWGMNPATTTVGAKNMENEEEKELTSEGAVSRLGDVLHACVSRSLALWLLDFYQCGYIDDKEYQEINKLGTSMLQTFRENMPEESALKPLRQPNYYHELSRNPIDGKKSDGKKNFESNDENEDDDLEEDIDEENEDENIGDTDSSTGPQNDASIDEKRKELNDRLVKLDKQEEFIRRLKQ